jgi:hypothetical protein
MGLPSKLIRNGLVVAAAIAMPLSMTAVTGVTGAGAAGPADPPVTCSVGSTLTFAPPGISKAGSVTAAKKSFSTISAPTFGGGCSGSGPANTIQFPNVHCMGQGVPASNPACHTVYSGTLDGYDSWANFESSRMTTAVQKSLKSLSFTINGIPYATKGTVASQVLAGGLCGSEVGFHLVATVKSPKPDKGQTVALNLCLGTITGSGLTSSTFSGAASDQNGTVATAAIDPATSTLHVG